MEHHNSSSAPVDTLVSDVGPVALGLIGVTAGVILARSERRYRGVVGADELSRTSISRQRASVARRTRLRSFTAWQQSGAPCLAIDRLAVRTPHHDSSRSAPAVMRFGRAAETTASAPSSSSLPPPLACVR